MTTQTSIHLKQVSVIGFDTTYIKKLEVLFKNFLKQNESDTAHDLAHIQRVVTNAKKLLEQEDSADYLITISAAWLHDCVVLPKNHPERKKASILAANKASQFLSETDFPSEKISAVAHAIESHSFSAGIKPATHEAEIVQDADRLDALGAIGIARCFMVGGTMERPLYNPEDPFCESREPDDSKWNIDHFYQKLFRLPELMNTISAKKEAERRVGLMKLYLAELRKETDFKT